MSPIVPAKLQSLEYDLGSYLAIRYCAPLAFFMVLRATGYVPKDVMPGPFCKELDRERLSTTNDDWSRPALTSQLRKKYKASIVSWSFFYDSPDIDAMKKAGYLETNREIEFFKQKVKGKSLKEIVQSGFPVIVTMKPGFGHEDSGNIHAVVVAGWDDKVKIYDPDARNTATDFEPEYVEKFLDPKGAGSIILPK